MNNQHWILLLFQITDIDLKLSKYVLYEYVLRAVQKGEQEFNP